ncbi:hypothetical protein EGH24_11600 [Halonotius terrestris]|uniref:Uncharacterized protein n=1 Tax=Halonotius terrestris TaxID=2487750 RepID=A0A8J8TC13_9EURY|nr:hypothetical protein [Halonotius terrestris]TQQ79270.1 hypothetical protein EGH24_11600 [Halonotius terrestris]
MSTPDSTAESPRDSAPRQLVVGVDLTLHSEAGEITVHTADGQLVVDADSLAALRALYGLRGNVRATASNWLPKLDAVAAETPLVFNSPAEISVRGQRVARYTPGSESGLLGRLLSVGPIQPAPVGLIRAVGTALRQRIGRRIGAFGL